MYTSFDLALCVIVLSVIMHLDSNVRFWWSGIIDQQPFEKKWRENFDAILGFPVIPSENEA